MIKGLFTMPVMRLLEVRSRVLAQAKPLSLVYCHYTRCCILAGSRGEDVYSITATVSDLMRFLDNDLLRARSLQIGTFGSRTVIASMLKSLRSIFRNDGIQSEDYFAVKQYLEPVATHYYNVGSMGGYWDLGMS